MCRLLILLVLCRRCFKQGAVDICPDSTANDACCCPLSQVLVLQLMLFLLLELIAVRYDIAKCHTPQLLGAAWSCKLVIR